METPHPLANTSKYKQYVLAVDKALKSFENTNEWADLISALGKLAKVFAQHSKFGDIPKAVTVAKRLSQCLHPALPMGVHLKALETYRQIFDILGREVLPRQLYLYAVGLFPLMDHCGIKVKGELLSIFEQYLLPLGVNLRPSLPGFLAGVLLGLEEGTEYFERFFALLDKVCEAVGAQCFYASLWETVLGAPSVRLPALIYVNAKFDKSRSLNEQMHIVGDSVNHMVIALCAAAEDTGTPLVQRNLLDLLCAALPLDCAALTRENYVQLLRRSLFVVLRRDMSLNRRLFTWILNPSGAAVMVTSVPVGNDVLDTSFFTHTVLPMVVDALKQFLELDTVEVSSSSATAFYSSSPAMRDADQQFVEVRLCRLLTYLQDRPEVGRPVLLRVLPLLLKTCSRLTEDEDYEEERMGGEGESGMRPSRLSLRLSLDVLNVSDPETSEEAEKTKIRRREEVAKNLNVLMQSVDEEGFLWRYMADYYEWLLAALRSGGASASPRQKGHAEGEADERTGMLVHLPPLGQREAVEEIRCYPRVLSYSLSMARLSSSSSVRSRHLPLLLRRLLRAACTLEVVDSREQMVEAALSMAGKLLAEISKTAGGALDESQAATDPTSPVPMTDDADEQALIESCLAECLRLLSRIARFYCDRRCNARWPLVRSSFLLVRAFGDLPLYCAVAPSFCSPTPKPLPEWVEHLLEVISVDSWLKAIQDRKDYDFEPRATALELLIRLCIRSSSVIAQHAALDSRSRPGDSPSGVSTVLLKPLLYEGHIRTLEESGVFEKSSKAAWANAGSDWPQHHTHAARLVKLLHSRRPSEASSAVEQIMVDALNSKNPVESTEAARTFHRIWTLARSEQEMDGETGAEKPFNRVVMILLSFLADDSLSLERIELKTVSTSWFVDCARHNDLPKIIQMLATMLMNAATARVSIQYVKEESRLSHAEVPSLPVDYACVTLLAADQRQRLHHLIEEADEPDGPWMQELRSRLLASSSKETKLDLFTPAPIQSDVPNFDDEEETDSLDTLSLTMDGVEHCVVEAVQWIVDCVVDEEESELDAQRRFTEAMGGGKTTTSSSLPDVVPDSARTESSVCTARQMTPEEIERALQVSSSCDSVLPTPATPASTTLAGAPPPPDTTVTRMRRGHRRQDSLAETIFNMSGGELRLFDGSDILKKEGSGAGTVSSASSVDTKDPSGTGRGPGGKQSLYHDLHAHMLLYAESGRVVDLGRAETAFRILTALLRPRGGPVPASILLNCLISPITTAPIAPVQSADGSSVETASLPDLMSRHVRAILGQQFWANVKEGTEPVSEEARTRNLTQLELIVTISLHFLRSYFVNSPIAPVTENDLVMSWKCKMAVLELLSELLRELSSAIQSQQSRAFVLFVQSILSRAKLQKCLLLLLVSSVHEPRKATERNDEVPLSMLIAEFNEGRRKGVKTTRGGGRVAGLVAAYNRSLLTLTAATIRLEFEIKNGFNSFTEQLPHRLNGSPVLGNDAFALVGGTVTRTALRELPASLVELRVFLLTVLNALKKCPDRHEGWLQLVLHILPWLDRALPKLCMRVTEQLCKNVETCISVAYGKGGGTRNRSSPDETPSPDNETASGNDLGTEFPANFAVTTLEALTTILHFCVVDTSSAASIPDTPTTSLTATGGGTAGGHGTPTSGTGGSSWAMGHALAAVPGTRGATELITSLVKVFSFSDSSSSTPHKLEQRTQASSWKQARSEMLIGLPHSLATICDVWSVVHEGARPGKPVGTPQQLHHLVLDLLSPIAQYHQQHFLSSLALVWLTRGDGRDRDADKPTFVYTRAQLDMTSLLLNLKVIPFESLIVAISDSLREVHVKGGAAGKITGHSTIDKPALFPTETPLLELLHGCVRAQDSEQLIAVWPFLYTLMAEAPLSALPSRSVFLLFIILCDFVRVCTPCAAPIEERMKVIIKQVQEVTNRLVEACNSIVGWQLEQPTWLKRTLVVKHDSTVPGSRSTDVTPSLESVPLPSLASTDASQRASTVSLLSNKPPSNNDSNSAQFSLKTSGSNLRSSIKDTNNNKRDPAESTRALFLLAENLAELVDCVCRSEEKERLLPVLHAVWANVVPYLRAKNARNCRFFLASSQLLASMSSYSYMRPVWRKTTMELLLDSTFFKMDMQSLRQWLVVIDHLMTHEKTSFRDLLKSISYAPNASLTSLMTSKEQEYEARTQSLKRLAFVLLGSELDQYRPQLPDVQERLAENLRLCQAVPSIRAAVFLCYRVLLLRLNAASLVSMWPAMLTELVHVLLQVEQQLAGATEGSDDLASAKDDQWMQLYLAACKLLESLCTLPAGYIAQFQMCHWAFVNSVPSTGTEVFVPFAGRIHRLLQTKYGPMSRDEIATATASLANMKHLTGFDELRPFFYTLCNSTTQTASGECLRDASILSGTLTYRTAIRRLEHSLYVDFAEHWQL